MNGDDKLGLTLCDGVPVSDVGDVDDDPATSTTAAAAAAAAAGGRGRDDNEVYIQAIAVNSLAAADGRLCRGDILLQVFHLAFWILF